MKPLHQLVTGHDLLAVERFQDDTRYMIEFLVLTDNNAEPRGSYIRLFLTEDSYRNALDLQNQGEIRIRKHFHIIEGHILPDKPKKRRGKSH